jgi:hypothetical protein
MQETMTLANAHPVTHPSPITPADCKAAAKRLRDRAPGRAPDTADLPKLDRRSYPGGPDAAGDFEFERATEQIGEGSLGQLPRPAPSGGQVSRTQAAILRPTRKQGTKPSSSTSSPLRSASVLNRGIPRPR